MPRPLSERWLEQKAAPAGRARKDPELEHAAGHRIAQRVSDRSAFDLGAAERGRNWSLRKGRRRIPDDRAEQIGSRCPGERRQEMTSGLIEVREPPFGVEGEDSLTDAVERFQRVGEIEQPGTLARGWPSN